MFSIKRAIDQIHNTNIKNNMNLELNGLRGAACLLVFTFHCRVLSGSPDLRPELGLLFYFPLFGAYAVDLFFVLSGFFIILPYVKTQEKPSKKISLVTYYKKKFARIFPAYYLNLLVMFGVVVPLVLGFKYLSSEPGTFMLLAHLSFLQYMHPATSSSLGMNGALWTLSITFQFFLIFPFVKNLFINGKEKIYLFVFIAISVLWKYLAWYDMDFLYKIAMEPVSRFGVSEFTIRFFLSNQLPANLSHFAIGMFLGNLYIKSRNRKGKGNIIVRYLLRVVLLSGLILALYSFRVAELSVPPWFYLWRLCVAAGSGCLIYLTAIDGPIVFKMFFRNKYLGFLGNLSYEIYLWHVLILYVLNKTILINYIKGVNLFWLFIFLGGAITILISYTSMKLVSFMLKPMSKKDERKIIQRVKFFLEK